MINDPESDFTRYIYFYISYLVENGKINEAKVITDEIEFLNSTLLLSQGKSWIDNGNLQKFKEVFSCKNHNDLIAEILFLISNLYSAQDNYEMSNFYLNLSNFLNPRFVFNLSLVAENHYFNKDYEKAKKVLKKFKKDDDFYYWFRLKKEAQIISAQRNNQESLNFIKFNFDKIENPNEKILFDGFLKIYKPLNLDSDCNVIEETEENNEIIK